MKNLFKILTFLCLTTTLILPVISCHSQRPKFGNNEDPSYINYVYNKYNYVPLYFENPADAYFDNDNLPLTYYFTGQILNILDNKTNCAFSNYLNDFNIYKQYTDYIKYHH